MQGKMASKKGEKGGEERIILSVPDSESFRGAWNINNLCHYLTCIENSAKLSMNMVDYQCV